MTLFVVWTELFSVELFDEDEPLSSRIGAKVEIVTGVEELALIPVDVFVSLV